MISRSILLWAVVVVLTPSLLRAAKRDRSEVACVEKLQLPDYPRLAMSAVISGTVTVRVELSRVATTQKITTDFAGNTQAKSIFTSPVESCLRKAKFKTTCGGKTVTLIFHFELVGKGSDYPRQSTWFGAPNTFWIESDPLNVQP